MRATPARNSDQEFLELELYQLRFLSRCNPNSHEICMSQIYPSHAQTIRINGRSFPWVFLARLIRSWFASVNPRKEMRVPRAVRRVVRFSNATLPFTIPLCQPLCESTCFNDQLTDRARATLSTSAFAPRVFAYLDAPLLHAPRFGNERAHCDWIFPVYFLFFGTADDTNRLTLNLPRSID